MGLTGLAIGAGIGGLGSLIGGIGGAIGANKDPTKLDATVNPYTAGQMSNLQNLQGQYDTPNSYEGNISQIMGSAPELQQMLSGIMGGSWEQLQNTAGLQAQENMNLAASQYGNVGAANSGAAMSAIGRGAALPYSQALSQMTGMRTNAGSNILNQAFGNLGQTNAMNAGILNTILQGQTGLANPGAWPQDSYMTGQQGPSGSLGGMFSGLGGLMMGIAPAFGGGSGNGGSGWGTGLGSY